MKIIASMRIKGGHVIQIEEEGSPPESVVETVKAALEAFAQKPIVLEGDTLTVKISK